MIGRSRGASLEDLEEVAVVVGPHHAAVEFGDLTRTMLVRGVRSV